MPKRALIPSADPDTDPHVRVLRGIFGPEDRARLAKTIDEENLFEAEQGQMPFKPKGVLFTRKKRETHAFSLTPKGSGVKKAKYKYSNLTRKQPRAEKTATGRAHLEIAKRASEAIKEHLGIEIDFNTAIQTRYSARAKGDGSDNGSLGLHKDTSPNLPADSLVCSYHVSGEARPLVLRCDADGSKKQVVFGPGDLCVMLPGTQATHTHAVPHGLGERITGTYRRVTV